MLRQQRDVFEPLAQRGNLDGNDRQPVIQVFAEAAGEDFFVQRFVGGGQHAHADGDALGVAHAPDHPFLQNAQELGLERLRHGVDLVEKDRAVMGFLEEPHLVLNRPRESPFFVAEEFAFQQVFRQGRAVDGHKRVVLAAAVEMERAGYQLLARAALALDEDGAVGVGHLGDQIIDLLHLRAGADDVLKFVAVLELLLEIDVFAHGALEIERPLDGHLELVDFERFCYVIIRPELHGLHGGFHGSIPGDHDHGWHRAQAVTGFEDIKAAHAFHFDVRDDDLRHAAGQRFNGAFRGVERKDMVTQIAAEGGDHLHHRGFVVDD